MNKKLFIELNDETYQKLYAEYLKVLKSPMYVTLETKPSFEEYLSSVLVSYVQKIDEMASFMNKESLENMKKQMENLFGGAGASGLDDMFSAMFGTSTKKPDTKKEKEDDKDLADMSKLKS